MKQIPLASRKRPGRFALVDDEDYDLVSQFRWNLYETKRRFLVISTARYGERILLHHLVLGLGTDSSAQIAFKDNDGLNCQKENLIHRIGKPKTPRTKYKPRTRF